MALDDPVVIVLIVAAIVFLFGGTKIPKLARSLGEARREFDKAVRGEREPEGVIKSDHLGAIGTAQKTNADALVVAAQREGIDTNGKTREQLASELSWKLNKKFT